MTMTNSYEEIENTPIENLDLDTLKEIINKTQQSMAERNSEIFAAKEALAEIQKQFKRITDERVRLEKLNSADSSALRELEKKKATVERLRLVKEEQARLAKDFEEKAKHLDELTASAKWREFAFDHQIEGGKRLAVAKRGILADKRGLGKTLTSLIWADMVQGKRVLVIAPNDVVPQFEDEIRTWAPGRTIFSMRGLPQSQRKLLYPMFNMIDEFIITLNYEAWRKDKSIIDELIKAGIDTVICDEAHRIKSADKITARGVFQITYRPNYCSVCDKIENFEGSWYINGKAVDKFAGFDGYRGGARGTYHPMPACPDCGSDLESTVKNVLCMTGTPILNKPQELFSLLFLVNMQAFPSDYKFIEDYCYQYAPNRFRFLPGGLEKLTKSMSQFFLQRTREDAGIHIPPPAVTIHTLEKDKVAYEKQYKAEEDITKKAQLLLEDGTRKDIFFILEILMRERQCMTWPAGIIIKDEHGDILCHYDVEQSQKLDVATELLMELCEEEERVIVFSQFKAPLYEMQNRVQKAGYSAAMATGDQTDSWKTAVRNDFDLKTAPESPRFQVCLATYKAFGTGINLNAARHIIILDDEWNPGMEDQAIGRIDRMNSTDQANVHIFRIKDSVDDFMASILDEKRQIVDGFNESITADQLMSFFKRS